VRVAFISPCGWGNLGDAAIVDSLLSGIRKRRPDAEVVGFTQNPDDTVRRHGIEALPLGAFSLPKYTVRARGAEARSEATPEPESEAASERAPWGARRLLTAIPGLRSTYQTGRRVLAERRFRQETAARLRGFDAVVVAGGGQLDEFWGGPFGHPFTLVRFGTIARAVNARYVMLSVGTGTLRTRLGVMFVRRARRLADYRSFRDAKSRELVRDPEVAPSDPVVPDLAYGLPLERPLDPPAPRRPVIGVSPMAFADPRAWPEQDAARYRAHVSSFADLTVRLLQAGNEVVLFATDGSDKATAGEMAALVSPRLSEEERGRLRAPPVEGVSELMQVLASVEVVVAARLHGVLLAHVAGRPALAISHERKVATLMGDMGHSRYCFEIDAFDVEAGWQRFLELYEARARLGAEIREAVTRNRALVDAQYDQMFGGPS
jgi:polysaccharide pyruvyl transferase WcaK-like protein